MLERALAGQLKMRRMPRIQLTLNQRPVAWLALNDVLITHPHPAATSRYELQIGKRAEEQKSSGLWIATPAGSTGAVAASGGRPLPWTSRTLQYRVREAYKGRLSKPRLIGGLCSEKTPIALTWLGPQGVACIDGARFKILLHIGDRLRAQLSMKNGITLLGK